MADEFFKGLKTDLQPYFLGDILPVVPVGTILPYVHNTPQEAYNFPKYFLPCWGYELQISEYPELAACFENACGSVNFFGGDGITTFKIPDLRGEFIRCCGTNGHTGEGAGGAKPGVHQDLSRIRYSINNNYYTVINFVESPNDTYYGLLENADGGTTTSNRKSYVQFSKRYIPGTTTDHVYFRGVRPTFTAFRFMIALKTVYNGGRLGGGVDYTTSEQDVGVWTTGDRLYQRTFVYEGTVSQAAGNLRLYLGSISDGSFVAENAFITDGFVILGEMSGYSAGTVVRLNLTGTDQANTNVCIYSGVEPDGRVCVRFGESMVATKIVVTVRYTKKFVVHKLTPVLSADDSHIICSSENSTDRAAWKAFNGDATFSSAYPYWLPQRNDVPSWLGYHFDEQYTFYHVILYFSNDYQTWPASDLVIQASNDGITWVDISDPFTISIPASEVTSVSVTCTSMKSYSYIRFISPTKAMAVRAYQPACYIAEMEIYGL